MRTILSGLTVGSTMILALFLAGCPQGAGASSLFGQDDNADAAADADADAANEDASDGGDVDATGDAARTSGALCGTNGLDLCAPMQCDPIRGCVECARDADCPATAPLCLAGQCVGCRPGHASDGGASDCPATTACSVEDYECHPACKGSESCTAGLTCDQASGECVGCVADSDCQSGVCSKTLRKCVECVDDTTCAQKHPRCRVSTGSCVACLSNDDCGKVQPICDALTFSCRGGCSSDAQCPGQRCELTTAKCIALPAAADASADGG